MIAGDHQPEAVGDADRAGDFDLRAGVRYIPDGAVDHAAIELNGACLQYPVPGRGAMVLQHLKRFRDLGGLRTFRRLLLSDIFIRTCEGLVDVFIVLYVTNLLGVSPTQFGFLIGVQTITSIAVYVPAARIADSIGRKPFVIATFVAFSLFPVALVWSHTFAQLIGAFIVGGLREIGEPARKALIVDLAKPHLRARSVGLYYLVRSCAIAPAGFIGGVLWRISPAIPFYAAGVCGAIGTLIFFSTVAKEEAG